MTVATPFGECAAIRRKIGIHQGSAFSCLASLLVLEPFHRLQDQAAQQDAYRLQLAPGSPGITAQVAGYYDDHCSWTARI